MYSNHDLIRAEFNILRNGVDIYILKYEDGKKYLVTNMEVDELKEGLVHPAPPLTLQKEEAQELFNDLWRAGFRPFKLDETPAKDSHIEDLRKIAFHALGIK